jgi:hypothetical protein
MATSAIVPIKTAWLSKINWVAVGSAVMALAVAFGVNISDADKTAILTAIPVIAGTITWILRTWFNGTVSPASLANNGK